MRSWIEEWEDWDSRHPGEPRRQTFGAGFEIGAAGVRRTLSDEVYQLKATVLELQNQLMAMAEEKKRWRVLHDEQSLAKSMASDRATVAESRANALAQKLEASEAECRERLARNQELSAALCKAEANVRELEDRLAITENSRNSNHEKRLIAESEARALLERIERVTKAAFPVGSDGCGTYNPDACLRAVREVLRGR